jgi:Toprim domain
MTLDFETLQQLSRGAERVDVACPLCGPHCKTGANRTRKTLRIFNPERGFATYYCARCDAKGYAHESGRRVASGIKPVIYRKPQPDPEKESNASLARQLWRRRQLIGGTIAETYLRDVRGLKGPFPETLGFLPAHGGHKPGMIAAFGIPQEPEPGVLEIIPGAVTGIHLTRLLPDGSGKDESDGKPAKIMLGPSMGQPIVLAPCNDLLGLVITEGIEDSLTAHLASGRGAWAAGSANRLSALGDVVPSYVESVIVVVDDDDAGKSNAKQLIRKLFDRGFEVRVAGAVS